ncbi:MAG: hypothetical protein BA863_04055 [Desulfovibrio sp. S3730MH75]|nr:MAG: hypothetical protein BA863_04055 [Desulfovibrio sp. S3730MH75]
MRTIKEADISRLRKDGKVKSSEDRNLKSVIPIASKKTANPKMALDEKQVRALESISARVALMLQAHNKNFSMLLEAIVQAKPIINIPEMSQPPVISKPIKRWEFIINRGIGGFIESIVAKAE